MNPELIGLYQETNATVPTGSHWGFLLKGRDGNRFNAHIRRLLEANRTEAERNLASALMAFKNKELVVTHTRQADMVILGESADTCMWWTIAPYIFQILTDAEHQMSVRDALQKLMDWAASHTSHDMDQELFELDGLKELNGVERYCLYMSTFTLSTNADDISHRCAKALARYIVETFLLKE